ncbi:MAG: 5'/3'-nucleotidase SurE [Fidelibacterota bacterium]
MSRLPNILIANDDGIYADGIYALWEAMREIGNVTVVAPDTEKSAVGHAITLSDPIRIQEVKRGNGFRGFSVDGTPADCVKIAVQSIMDSPPDFIASGINAGANVGKSLIYSGTLSAATEGTILGIPSMAISFNSVKGGNLEPSKVIAQKLVKIILQHGLPRGTLLNVNVPTLPVEKIKGFRITKQGNIYFKDRFEKREDPRGRLYYWMTGNVVDPDPSIDYDGKALSEGFVSITPIQFQMTNLIFMEQLKSWDFS